MKIFDPFRDSRYIELNTDIKENEKLVFAKYMKATEKIKKELLSADSDN